jgi:DNA-binding MarR family transcriptional regulator
MSLDALDPVLTNPKRLAALGVLANNRDVEFTFLREVLDVSDSDLSKQMRALGDAGYLSVRKTGRGRGRRTWFRISRSGRAALHRHAHALDSLVNAAPTAPGPEVAIESSTPESGT